MTAHLHRPSLYGEAINKIACEIGDATALQPLFNYTVSSIQREFGFYVVSIFVYYAADDAAMLLAQAGQSSEPAPIGAIQAGDLGIVGEVIRTGRSILLNNVLENPLYIAPQGYTQAKSEICVPIMHNQFVWGVINVESDQLNTFSEEDRLALETIAKHLGDAVDQLLARAERAR